MRSFFRLLPWILVCAFACGPQRSPVPTLEIQPHAAVEGFAIVPQHVVAHGDVLMGSVHLQVQADTGLEQRVVRWDEAGKMDTVTAFAWDRTSGRISNLANGRYAMSASATGDAVFSRVDFHIIDAATRQTVATHRPSGELLNVPSRRALALGESGTLWVLAVDDNFVLTMFGFLSDGTSLVRPLAARITPDFSSELVSWEHGLALVTQVRGDDQDAQSRLNLDPSTNAEDRVVLALFDIAGNPKGAHVLDVPVGARPGALWAKGSELAVAGTVSRGLGDASGFISTWHMTSEGVFEHGHTRLFDAGDKEEQVTDVMKTDDGHILATGEEGFEQVSTGSVVQGSRGFVALFPADGSEPSFHRWGDGQRRNAGAAVYAWKDGVWMMARNDFPKTHDADEDAAKGYSRTEIYTVTIR